MHFVQMLQGFMMKLLASPHGELASAGKLCMPFACPSSMANNQMPVFFTVTVVWMTSDEPIHSDDMRNIESALDMLTCLAMRNVHTGAGRPSGCKLLQLLVRSPHL